VLLPTASVIVDPFSNRYPNWAVMTEGGLLYDWLYKNDYPAFIVPEEYILNGKEDLRKFRLLVLPVCTYVPEELPERLLAWVKNGGTLVLDGPAGLFNQYARPDNRLLTTLFGTQVTAECVTEANRGKGVKVDELPGSLPIPWQGMKFGGADKPTVNIKGWRYDISLKDTKPTMKVLLPFEGGKIGLAEARYGKGRAILSAFGLAENGFKEFVLQQARQQYPDPLVKSSVGDTLGYVMREAKDGRRYLFVLNHNAEKPLETALSVRDVYRRVNDLGIEGGFPVPSIVKGRRTEFRMVLAPGDGTCLELRH
jgi:beta-galactosidase GanA